MMQTIKLWYEVISQKFGYPFKLFKTIKYNINSKIVAKTLASASGHDFESKVKKIHDKNLSLDNLSVGYFLFQQGSFESSILFLERHLASFPNDFYCNLFLISSLQQIGDDERALDFGVAYLRNNQSNVPEILNQLASSLGHPKLNLCNEGDRDRDRYDLIKATIATIEEADATLAAKLYFYLGDCESSAFNAPPNIVLGEIVGVQEIAKKGLAEYTSLGEPNLIYDYNLNTQSLNKVVKQPVPYIAEITEVTISWASSLIVKGNYVISDYLSHPNFGEFCVISADPTFLARQKNRVLLSLAHSGDVIERGVMLNGTASSAFGHWTQEFLPKLRFLEQHPDFEKFDIIVDGGMPKTHYEYLRQVTSNNIRELQEGHSYIVKKLLVAPTDSFFPTDLTYKHQVPVEYQSTFTKDAILFLRQKVLNKPNLTCLSGKRIFLNRRSSSWRKCVNEKKLAKTLSRYNFTSLDMTTTSFDQQVEIFRTADFIIAENGSALNNLIFCKFNTPVIILGSRNTANLGAWFGNFLQSGFNLHYFFCDSIRNDQAKHQDYEVDIPKLVNLIRPMLTHT